MTKIFVVAGGTGGHVYPALAARDALREEGYCVSMVTDRRGQRFLKGQGDFVVKAAPVMGAGVLQKVRAAFVMGLGYLACHRVLLAEKPDLVIGFGGYATFPMLLAAQHQGRATIVHEQNAVMGRVNRLLAGRARRVALSFAETRKTKPGWRCSVVGNLIAGARVLTPEPHGDQVCLMVLGGSQGAAVFDDTVPEAVSLLPERIRRRLRVVQQVVGDPVAVMAGYRRLGVESECAPFIDDAWGRMVETDLLIARAGGGVTAEVSLAGVPAIYVPLAVAADDHQWFNAGHYVNSGGALVLREGECRPTRLAELLEALLDDDDRRAQMAQAMRDAARPGALDEFVGLVKQSLRMEHG